MPESGAPASSADLVGWRFPGGVFVIEADENRRLCELLGDKPRPDGAAHPLYAYVATQRASGIGVGELIEMLGTPIEDGPMLGSVRLTLDDELRTGRPYTVSGSIRSITRKHGATLGAFDLAEFELELAQDGRSCARARNTFVLPCRSER